VLVSQIYFTGVEALPILALISLGIGAAVIIQGVSLLPQFGQNELAYKILILVITRELGPLLTALFIAARSGSAITTELGNMVVDHEIEAYTAAGVDPIAHLAAPRLIGVTVAVVVLNLYFNLFGLLGSCALASLIHGLPISEYLGKVVLAMTSGDLATSLVKSVVFGNILATVATYYGFRVDRAVTEVPQKTIQSLGMGMTLCILANTIITILFRLG
jgi:phospholipid/cholesterol/gamma-HCH transport system permease protein